MRKNIRPYAESRPEKYRGLAFAEATYLRSVKDRGET